MHDPTPSLPERRYPVHLVTGAWGSGKSSLLNALLSLRPANERWAVLLNELGQTPVSGEPSLSSRAGVVVREATGGCACCTGQIVFVTALATLIRQTRPERVFVECSSQAAMPAVFHALHESFANVVTLESVIALAGPNRPTASLSDVWPSLAPPRAFEGGRDADYVVCHHQSHETTDSTVHPLAWPRVIYTWPSGAELARLLDGPSRFARPRLQSAISEQHD